MAQQKLSAAAQEAIEIADAQVNNFGLPTYTQLQAALNELATYVQHGASADAIKASAERARQLANPA